MRPRWELLALEPSAMARAPPSICWRRHRRFLMMGAPLQIICRCAADAMLVRLIISWHFSGFACFRYKCLPQCKIEVDVSRQQFVPMLGLQDFTLRNVFFKSSNSSKSENIFSIYWF